MQLWIHCAVICMFGISLHAWHVKILGTGSCLAASIEQVDWCPRTKYDWELQARRKNCSNIVLPCFKYNLLYHCLINTWQNRMYSVCAAPDNILDYHCAEFNMKGNRVQPNYDTDCRNFSKPCPFKYPSTLAYKYQGCYELVHQAVLQNESPDSTMTTENNKDLISKNRIQRLPVCNMRTVIILLFVAFLWDV